MQQGGVTPQNASSFADKLGRLIVSGAVGPKIRSLLPEEIIRASSNAGHSLLEVRRRAIQSLEFKFSHNLLKMEDLLQASCGLWLPHAWQILGDNRVNVQPRLGPMPEQRD